MRYIIRTIALPFFMGLLLVRLVYLVGLESYYFVKFGGEFVLKSRKETRTIAQVMDYLNDKLDENNSNNPDDVTG